MSQHVDQHHKEQVQSTTTPPGTAQDKGFVKGQSTLPYWRPPDPCRWRGQWEYQVHCWIHGQRHETILGCWTWRDKQIVKWLEPLYNILGRSYFAEKVVPVLYMQRQEKVMMPLKELDSTSIPTDGWTSRATQSSLTITANCINSDWEMINCVLQTCAMLDWHTGHNIAEVTAAVNECDLKRANGDIAIVTDTVRNMDVAVTEAGGSAPHLKCFTHTWLLRRGWRRMLWATCWVGWGVLQPSSIGEVMHAPCLKPNIKCWGLLVTSSLSMSQHNGTAVWMCFKDTWNSTHLLLQTSSTKLVWKNDGDPSTLSTSDIRDSYDIVKVLKPLKTAATVMCDEKSPTASLNEPLKHIIEKKMSPIEGDSSTVASIRRAILSNLCSRYSHEHHYLLEYSSLDPRFCTLPHLEEAEHHDVDWSGGLK